MEKTIDLARGGAAIDKTTRIPGPRIAPEIIINAAEMNAITRLIDKA